MSPHDDAVLAEIVATIRTTIAEDWIADFENGRETRFNEDLELESIEFVKIADALQSRYGARLDLVGWLTGKTIHELIGLSVGDLADFVAASTANSEA
jgi:acyl carrier protein